MVFTHSSLKMNLEKEFVCTEWSEKGCVPHLCKRIGNGHCHAKASGAFGKITVQMSLRRWLNSSLSYLSYLLESDESGRSRQTLLDTSLKIFSKLLFLLKIFLLSYRKACVIPPLLWQWLRYAVWWLSAGESRRVRWLRILDEEAGVYHWELVHFYSSLYITENWKGSSISFFNHLTGVGFVRLKVFP